MRRILLVLTLCTLFLGIALTAFAQEMTADEIVRKAEDIMRGSSNVGVMSMQIITPNWERTLDDLLHRGKIVPHVIVNLQ